MYDNYVNALNVQGIDNDIHDSGRGQPNGVATLDSTGRIPYDQLPESAMNLKGDWDASTNTPHLEAGVGTLGDMYMVSVAGTQDLGEGDKEFNKDDRILYNGSIWRALSASGVESINNKNGNVTLYGTDIAVSQTNGRNIPQAIADSKYNTTFTDTSDSDAAVHNITVPDFVLDSVNKPSFDLFILNEWNVSFSLNVNESESKAVKVYKNGSKVALTTKGNAGNTLRLIYDGTDFVVAGNPVVYTEDTKLICADGSDLNGALTNNDILSDWEDITIGTTQATATTMQYDGFLVMWEIGGNTSTAFHINNRTIYSGNYCSQHEYVVQKGDVIWGNPNTSSGKSPMARFYKNRNYSNR